MSTKEAMRMSTKEAMRMSTKEAMRMSTKGRFRPQLEFLEDRCVPTVFTWTGESGNGEWADGRNWNKFDPKSLEGPYPNSADDTAVLRGFNQINYRSYGAHTVSGILGTLTGYDVGENFSGTMNLFANLQITGSFSWVEGAIGFGGGSSILQLSGGVNGGGAWWSGGTIGDYDAAAQLVVDSGTDLDVTQDVILGVPLVIGDGSFVSDVTFAGSVTMPLSVVTVTVKPCSTLTFDGQGQKTFGPLSGGPGGHYIKGEGGNITFLSGSTWNMEVPLWNAGADVHFVGGARAWFRKTATETAGVSYYQTGGSTTLGTSGGTTTATVSCFLGYYQTGGDLRTYSTARQELNTNSSDPNTFIRIEGGGIRPGADLSGENFGNLRIDMRLILSGTATYYASVSRQTGNCTNLDARYLTINASAGSNQTTVNVTVIGTEGNHNWWCICYARSTNGFAGQFAYVTNGFLLDLQADDDLLRKVGGW